MKFRKRYVVIGAGLVLGAWWASKQRPEKVLRNVFLELPTRNRSLNTLAGMLEASGHALDTRLQQLTPSPRDIEVLCHIIGIERWGQRRLQVVQGLAYLEDNSSDYTPDLTEDWADLLELFKQTRLQTVEIARNISEDQRRQTVVHNQFGDLSVGAWLRYLLMHTDLEARRFGKKGSNKAETAPESTAETIANALTDEEPTSDL